MDESCCWRKAHDWTARFLAAFALAQWRVEVRCETLEQGTQALVNADPSSFMAYIKIDPAQVETEDDLLDVVRHEVLHLLHADIQLYRRAVHQLIDHAAERQAMDEVFDHVCERIVSGVERLLDRGLGKTAAKVVMGDG